jgi:hypothetical protein
MPQGFRPARLILPIIVPAIRQYAARVCARRQMSYGDWDGEIWRGIREQYMGI